MTKLPKIPARIRSRIRRFEHAVESYAFLGASDPEDHAAIREEYKNAKRALYTAVEELLSKHSLAPRAVEDTL